MNAIRLLLIGLLLACAGLVAAPPQRDLSPSEARQIGKERQKSARKQAKLAQREASQRQKEVAREIKYRDSERRRESKQLTKDRREQGKQVEARADRPQKPASPSHGDKPSKDQPSPIERLRGYSDSEPKQQ